MICSREKKWLPLFKYILILKHVGKLFIVHYFRFFAYHDCSSPLVKMIRLCRGFSLYRNLAFRPFSYLVAFSKKIPQCE